MTLVKIHFVNIMKSVGQEVGRRLVDKVRTRVLLVKSVMLIRQSLSETASQALLYTKFSSLASSLRPLLAELEDRANITPDELAALLGECHTAWVTTRQNLLGSLVYQEVVRMNPSSTDLVDLVGSSVYP
jgi:hypothetical protein